PGDADEVEEDQGAERAPGEAPGDAEAGGRGRRGVQRAGEAAVGDEVEAVEGAPGDEGPGGAVPEAAQEHGGHEVELGAHRALAVAAQGDVEVVAEPGGEADVPAAPELAGVARGVGHGEV